MEPNRETKQWMLIVIGLSFVLFILLLRCWNYAYKEHRAMCGQTWNPGLGRCLSCPIVVVLLANIDCGSEAVVVGIISSTQRLKIVG